MKKIFYALLLFIFFLTPSVISAKETLPSISVINQIRGPQSGLENADLLTSLKAQFSITKKYSVPGTWLWQFSALEDKSLTSFAKTEMKDQEMGLFLEIDRNFAQKALVLYRGQGPWYFSDGLFLFSYDQGERKKFIDTAFAHFYEVFGYYPKSVGAWWIDSWSLSYMHDTYGVTSSLRAADQLDLDVYSIWGTPWSIPYVASRTNAATPARDGKSSSGVLVLQWASRDPLLGYGSSPSASLYSLQDYFHFKDIAYFQDLLTTYLNGPGKNAVIGLEGGYAPEVYEGMYERHLQVASKLALEGKTRIVSAKEYAQEYFDKSFNDSSYILRDDFDSSDQAFWYQSSSYRIGIHKKDNKLFLVDIRDYVKMPAEEYYALPNTQGYLRIDEPSLLDSSRFPLSKKLLLESTNTLKVIEKDSQVTLFSGNTKIARFSDNDFEFFIDGKISEENKKTFKEMNYSFLMYGGFGLFALYLLVMLKKFRKNKKKVFLTLPLLAPVIFSLYYLHYFLGGTPIFIFDIKMLVFSPLLLLPFSMNANIVLAFFFIPLTILFLLHYYFVVKKEGSASKVYILIYLIFFFIYFKLPYFPLTKQSALYAGLIIALLAVIKLIFLFKYKKSIKKMLFELGLLAVALLLLGVSVIFSRQQYLLNQFEINALDTLKPYKGKVVYLDSSSNPIYKVSAPLLWKYSFLGQFLTRKKWEFREDFITKSDGDNQELIFVPRYLGATIDAKGQQEHLFKPIFDNSSIVIYKK